MLTEGNNNGGGVEPAAWSLEQPCTTTCDEARLAKADWLPAVGLTRAVAVT
jgi:hypothetical protein